MLVKNLWKAVVSVPGGGPEITCRSSGLNVKWGEGGQTRVDENKLEPTFGLHCF